MKMRLLLARVGDAGWRWGAALGPLLTITVDNHNSRQSEQKINPQSQQATITTDDNYNSTEDKQHTSIWSGVQQDRNCTLIKTAHSSQLCTDPKCTHIPTAY